MGPSPLGLPPAALSLDALAATTLASSRLWRISAHSNGEPHFGATGLNRFDAPGCATGMPEYATCYLGLNLSAAVAESVLHDRVAENGRFEITDETLDAMYVHRFRGGVLQLLDLRGATLKRFGGHADLAGTSRFDITQQWSLAVFQNPQHFDGFVYMSRHENVSPAVAPFNRAKPRIRLAAAQPLLSTAAYAAVAEAFHIVRI